MICGNGGSAADATHIVGELMKSFVLPRSIQSQLPQFQQHLPKEDALYLTNHLQGGLSTLSLSGETSLTSAFSNDVAADLVFAQQVYGHAKKGDALLCLSTSGNAQNVLRAAQTAKVLGIACIGLTGQGGGLLKPYTTHCICVPQTETYKVQELHLPVYHTLCLMLEETFFGA